MNNTDVKYALKGSRNTACVVQEIQCDAVHYTTTTAFL